MKLNKIALLIAAGGLSAPAFATDGMNMEGYGPVATGMGGASYAYDNGTAGLINNPATLGLMASGTSRLDLAVGGLQPDVTTKMAGQPDAKSGGTGYYMPAVGYVRKDGRLAWGIGMMAQGGMGTEYGSSSLLSNYQSAGYLLSGGLGGSQGASGMANRSELGIGRLMFPLTYDVSDNLRIGGTIDYLWGGLDLQMVMSGAMFAQFTGFGGAAASPLGTASGSMVAAVGSPAFGIMDVNFAQFDFSEGSNGMKQRLTTDGWAGNVGFVWQATPQLSVGGVYHGKTSLKDMEGNGNLNMSAVTAGGPLALQVSGKLKVVNFQWPETYGLGVAYQATDKLMVAADYKRIGWAAVMRNFQMSFTAEGNTGMAAGLNGKVMDATLYQNWKNQNVVMIGGSYKYTDALTLRAGVSVADDPIPANLMNPLFPAIEKDHYTVGFGYGFSKVSSVDFSYTYAPKVSVTNDNMGVTTEHSQNNWQLMYSLRF
jgi:long-chain fatty acid transport protein